MLVLVTEDEVREMLAHRPEHTRTYPVAADVLHRITRDNHPAMRGLDAAEVTELAAYLGVPAAELAGPFEVVDGLHCGACGRRLSFLDFVKTAVDLGRHSPDQLAEVLTGRAGAWITIRGRDGGRPVHCAGCGRPETRPMAYSEYSNRHYAYA